MECAAHCLVTNRYWRPIPSKIILDCAFKKSLFNGRPVMNISFQQLSEWVKVLAQAHVTLKKITVITCDDFFLKFNQLLSF